MLSRELGWLLSSAFSYTSPHSAMRKPQMAWSQLVPLPRGVLGRQSTPCLSRQHSDMWTSPPSSPQRCALTVAVGVGVVPSAALLTPWPGKLRPAETPPGGVAASRQRPNSAAAAHCKREKTSALLWEYRTKLMVKWGFL